MPDTVLTWVRVDRVVHVAIAWELWWAHAFVVLLGLIAVADTVLGAWRGVVRVLTRPPVRIPTSTVSLHTEEARHTW